MQPAPDFEPRPAARKLIREARSGALATVSSDGHPYASLVNVATLPDGSPLLLLSRLAVHTRNLLAHPRVSLMLDERKEGDPLEGARVSLMGTVAPTEAADARRRYLARQPEAAMFVDFADFAFYRVNLVTAHLVAGFGRIVDLPASDLLIDLHEAGSLVAAEEQIIAQTNNDHADVVRLCATVLLGAPQGEWRCVGCDPCGLDLQLRRIGLRLDFPERVETPGGVQRALENLARRARASA
jgi:putative heme iron utilization protein